MEKNSKKILIIDDDENLQTVLGDKLAGAGFQVSQAYNGEEGEKLALAIHPDLILLDVVMPKQNGWDTLLHLRADGWGKTAKIVMLTVLDNTSDVSAAVEKNTYEYLLKTNYNLDEVVNKVKSSLGL